MAVYELDAKGMTCPGPALKMTSMTFRLKPGDTQEVIADCPAFEKLCGIGAIATR
jgi:TusA-related sulfurtransferase